MGMEWLSRKHSCAHKSAPKAESCLCDHLQVGEICFNWRCCITGQWLRNAEVLSSEVY